MAAVYAVTVVAVKFTQRHDNHEQGNAEMRGPGSVQPDVGNIGVFDTGAIDNGPG
ncbi:hypothetical protein RE428_29410 [Marinobacter nanhaiticus D15-8W]|nr:hypothetical protein RE428_29410 [Marinobacter nanhaiticus D15-8W]